MSKNMLVPLPWNGNSKEIFNDHVSWIKELGDDVWCDLWLRWPTHDMPLGYNLYIVSFHLEVVDINWIHKQAERISAPIILLSDSNFYDWQYPSNVYPYTFYWWHHQTDKIIEWFPTIPEQKNITHKFSAICRRITQSKLIIFTLLAEHAKDQSMLRLTDWEGQDSRIKTNNETLDAIYEIFYDKWFGQDVKINDTEQYVVISNQQQCSNPWAEIYQNCALHFTNESFHYSYMQDQFGQYNYPGPFLTEKTIKCLVGGTGFVPVGQFDTYNSLAKLGFNFDYNFNTDFDQDPGNITRLEKIVKLIEFLLPMDAEEIFNLTKISSEHNQDHVYSKEFYNQCEKHNQSIANKIISDF